jgi:hypothetical protein
MSDSTREEVLERERRKLSPDNRQPALHGAEGYAALPGPDDPYKAIGNASGSREEVLCVILGRSAAGGAVYRFFEYQHKASDTSLAFAEDGSHVMELRFVGPDSVKIVVTGGDLLRACHLINKHRIPWIRLFDPERKYPRLEVGGGKKTEIITSIEFIYDDPRHKPGSR